jgi:Uma2 family endonuclease
MTSPGTAAEPRNRSYVRPPAPLHFPSQEVVPETGFHLRIRTALFLLLDRALRGKAFVGSDQFVYWDATNPKHCLAPDVLVRVGGPLEILRSFKTWEHGAPHVAVEIISRDDRRDHDWEENLARYRRTGIREVVRFDPENAATPLRLWDNVEGDLVERDLNDPEGLRCDALGVYWVVVQHPELGFLLRIAQNADGTGLWPTPEEAEAEARAENEAALARIAELERELAARS